MAKKRKLESEPSQPPIVTAEEEEDPEEIIEEEEDPEEIIEEEEEIEYEDEIEYEEEEIEYEEEVEVEVEEENNPPNDGDVVEEPILSNNVGGDAEDALPILSNNGGGDVEEPIQGKNDGGDPEEPIQSNNVVDEVEKKPIHSVLAELSRDKLVELLSEAAARHADVAASVRASAYVDPSHRKIFVHGLKWDTTSEDLFAVFAKYGEIEDCRVIANKATGKSKGYGFVLFKASSAARHALKEPQKLIKERMTCSQLASLGPIATQQQPDCTQRKIYVSNAGEELDPEKVKEFFSKYGEIEEGPLGLDRETGKLKGFCLFTYKTVESAKSALIIPHKQFEDVTLYCQQAIDGPKPHKNVSKSLNYVENVASGVVDSPIVPPPYVQGPPPYVQMPPPYMQVPPMVQQPPPPMNMDPVAVEHALNLLGALGAMGAATGLLNNSAMVPGVGGPVMHPGYGGGMNMGPNGMNGSWNQGGFPNQMRWQGRGRGRGFHGPRP